MDSVAGSRIDEEELEELFGALAHETRLKILFALWRGHTATGDEPVRQADGGTVVHDRAVSFSTLKDAVGVKDGGQFNYHLGKLTGRFIERTDEGYVHLASGRAVYQAMVASIATDDEPVEPIHLDTGCTSCDGHLVATYEHQVFAVTCEACGEVRMQLPFLPAGVDGRDDDERVAAFEKWSRRIVSLATDGICPWCSGRMSVEPTTDEAEERCFGVRHDCERCEARLGTSVGESVVDHPAVVSLFYDHGIDLTEVPMWGLPFTEDDGHDVVGEDPWRAEVRIAVGNDERVLTVDDRMNVVAVEE